MGKETEDLIKSVKESAKSSAKAARRRERLKRDARFEAGIDVLNRLTNELKRITDSGKRLQEVHLHIYYDEGEISGSRVVASGESKK